MGRALSNRINARLDEGLARRVAELQRRTGRTITSLVEASLENYCAQDEGRQGSAHEIFQRSGFIGRGRGPRDLSRRAKWYLTDSLSRKT